MKSKQNNPEGSPRSKAGAVNVETTLMYKKIREGLAALGSSDRVDFETLDCTTQGKMRNIRVTLQVADMQGNPKSSSSQQELAERLANESAIIAEIGRVIGSSLEINEVYERFAEETRKLIATDRLVVTLQHPDTSIRTIAYLSGLDISGQRAPLDMPIAGTIDERIAQTRKSMVLQSSDASYLAGQMPSLGPSVRAGIRSFMAVPLVSRGQLIGVLVVESLKPNAYTAQDLSLAERIGAQIAGSIANAKLYDRLQDSEKELKKLLASLEDKVKERTRELEETNIALKILLNRRDEDRLQMGQDLQTNIDQLVLPLVNKLKAAYSDKQNLGLINTLEMNLSQISSPFLNYLSRAHRKLTPTELKIAALIKEGKMSKEIAVVMGVSAGTIAGHRNNIRKKLGLRLKDINLRSHLLALR